MDNICSDFSSLGECISTDPFGAKETENYKSTDSNERYMDEIDFSQLSVKSCLICLRHEGIISIYNSSGTTTIASKIKYFADITIMKDIGFPSCVCNYCANSINIAYKLRKQCQDSFKIFCNILKKKKSLIDEMCKVPPDAFCSVFLPELILTNENTMLQSNEIKKEADDFMYKNTGMVEEIPSSTVKSEPIDISELEENIRNEPLFIENLAYKCEFTMYEGVDNIDASVEKNLTSDDSNFIPKKTIVSVNDFDKICDDNSYYEGEKYPDNQNKIGITGNEDNSERFICEICGKPSKTLSILHNHLKLHEPQIYECVKCNKVCTTSTLLLNHSKIHNRRSRHICDQCDKTFVSKSTLKMHKQCVHLGIKKFECVICGKKMTTSSQYKLHLRFHTGEKPYNCDKCDEKFYSRYLLIQHSVKHKTEGADIDENRHECHICHRVLASLQNLQSHVNNHQTIKKTAVKPYKCSYCSKTYRLPSDKQIHERIHTGEKPYSCLHCDRKFRTASGRSAHVTVHTGEKPYCCTQCDSKFRRRSVLLQHVQAIHSTRKTVKPKRYKCSTCEKAFASSSTLRTHIKIHTGEKPYKCSTCSQRFRERAERTIHERKHLGSTTPHQCSICQKYFNSTGHLNAHLRMHSGEKPFDCPHCVKKFSSSYGRSKHITIHTGETPFSCTQCDAKFRLKELLQKHVKKSHLNENI